MREVALEAVARDRFDRTRRVSGAFFEREAAGIARATLEMARRFQRGGRLLVDGRGPAASDAAHVSVEFVHPVLVGKRALPALLLDDRPLTPLARPADVLLAIAHGPLDGVAVERAARARAAGLLAIALAGGRAAEGAWDHAFAVPDDDRLVVQEVQETLYHVLWELVHVFFEQGALG